MGLYKLFSYNVEVQYKSYILSKAMLFTIITTILNITLPFFLACRSRGFWLKFHSFYEQPNIHFTYEHLLVAETDDPSQVIVCGEITGLENEENCVEMQAHEHDNNYDSKNDFLDFTFLLNIPQGTTVASVLVILALDFQLNTVCPLQMQSLAVINKEFVVPPSMLKYYGDLNFYQVSHLVCKNNHIDATYNSSLFNHEKNSQDDIVGFILENYFMRAVTTQANTVYSRSENGHTGVMKIQIRLRVPEMKVSYIPSVMQELKWAWPQYLSMVVIFYWLFNKIKRFVFNHRLLMAWEIVPWKKDY